MKFPASMFSISILFVCISFLPACNDDSLPEPKITDILEKLQAIPGITVFELDAVDHFDRLFEIKIEQPVDHSQPNGATFFQKIYLGHVGEKLPVAFETEGYARSNHKTRELSPLLNINQLTVEHRYLGVSMKK